MALKYKSQRSSDATGVRGAPENSFGPGPSGRKTIVMALEKGAKGSDGIGKPPDCTKTCWMVTDQGSLIKHFLVISKSAWHMNRRTHFVYEINV
jgi:hypothetical protein